MPWLPIGVWSLAVGYALWLLDLGWFPVDAGTLGHAAERALAGELPHRDFADVYTGGLAFWNALAFEVLGVGVMSMRWAAFAVYCAWVPAVWYLAHRFAPAPLAAAATLLCAAWSLPVYSEGMPSWYNLFFATFGAAALLRFHESARRRWLVAAGLAGGLSVLVKIVGLYYVAAGLSFLVVAEALAHRGGPAGARPAGARDGGYRTAAAAFGLLLTGGVGWLVWSGMGARHLFLYGAAPLAAVVPVLALAARPTGRSSSQRLRSFASTAAPFLLGVALPVGLFLVPYVLEGAVADLLDGVFRRPRLRLEDVRMIGPAGAWTYALPAVLLAGWLVWAPNPSGPRGRMVHAVAWLGALAVLAFSHTDLVYVVTFRTLLWLPPIAGLAGLLALRRAPPEEAPRLYLMLVVFGLCSLVQIPFAAPVYFFYAAPLLVLMAVALAGVGRVRRAGLPVVLAGLTAFSVLRLHEGFTLDLGFRYRPEVNTERLVLRRAMGLRVSAPDKADYEELVRVVDAVAPGGGLFAAPDAPEVYFLTARGNPTRTLYEVLESGEGRVERTLALLDERDIQVVVVRPDPLFSPPLSRALLTELERRYPAGAEVGRFVVAWRP